MHDRKPGEAEVLLASRLWPAVLIPAGVLAALVAVGIWLMPTFPFVPVGFLFATVVVAWLQRGNALLADETGLLVRHRGRVTRRYRWEEIREAGLTRPGFSQVALAVYPDGGRGMFPARTAPSWWVGFGCCASLSGKSTTGSTRSCAPGESAPPIGRERTGGASSPTASNAGL